MSIIRIKKKEHPYVQVDKRVLEDSRLSWRAKGILVYLLTKPDGWTVKVADIWGKGTEGRNAVQACLEELRVIGYAQLVAIVGTGNKFLGKEWEVSEEPTGGFLEFTDKPKKEAPINRKSGNRGVNSNNESLSEINSNNEGERTPPAPSPSNLQSQKNESGLVSPPGFGNFDHFSGFGLDYLKTPETVKAETPPLPKVAPKGIPPVRLDAKEIRGLVDLTETYPFGFCETCQGQKVVGGRNGLIECPTCEGTGLGNGRTESENPPPAQFEVTAIASPTELPGVTLVEAAPIHHRRNGRIEIPDEAAAEILPWAKGDGEQTVKSWYDRAFRQHSPKDVEDMVMRFSTVFLSSEKAAFRDMMETNPLSFFKRRFAGFVADQKQYDRNNAPKEGGQTRQNPPANYTSSTRH